MTVQHEHAISHMPTSGTGIAVCECGATMRVVMGKPTEPWHGCPRGGISELEPFVSVEMCRVGLRAQLAVLEGLNENSLTMKELSAGIVNKIIALRKELAG